MAKKPSLLIVEDDPLLVRMYQDKFIQEGHKVEVASNGEEGLAKIREARPDVILLDIMMPKMNGYTMLSRLKADPEIKNIPVIMLTNLSGEELALKGLEMGAVGYIVKGDFPPEVVVKKVKEVITAYTRGQEQDVPEVGG